MMKLTPMNNAYPPPPEGPRVTPSTLRTGHLFFNNTQLIKSQDLTEHQTRFVEAFNQIRRAFGIKEKSETAQKLLTLLVAGGQDILDVKFEAIEIPVLGTSSQMSIENKAVELKRFHALFPNNLERPNELRINERLTSLLTPLELDLILDNCLKKCKGKDLFPNIFKIQIEPLAKEYFNRL